MELPSVFKEGIQEVTEITEDIFSKPPQKFKYPCTIDASAPNFRLKSLEGLELIKPSAVRVLNVSSNRLTELTLTGDYSALKQVAAQNNRIAAVVLECRRLTDLNLSNNALMEIPVLDELANLEKLDLSNNEIEGESFEPFLACKQLQYLFLANNKLNLAENIAFQDQISCLKQLPLHTISLSRNLGYRGYRPWIVATCHSLFQCDQDEVTREELAFAIHTTTQQVTESFAVAEIDDLQKPVGLNRGVSTASLKRRTATTVSALVHGEGSVVPGVVTACLVKLVNVKDPLEVFPADLGEPELNFEVQQLKDAFETDPEQGRTMVDKMSHEVVGMFLLYWMSELLEPVIPYYIHPQLLLASQSSSEEQAEAHTKLEQKLPPANLATLKEILDYLRATYRRKDRKRITDAWGEPLLGKENELSRDETQDIFEFLLTAADDASSVSQLSSIFVSGGS